MSHVNESPGCLTAPILIVVVPLRLGWELLAAIGRFTDKYVMWPIGWLIYNGLLRPLGWLFRHGVLRPLRWLFNVLVGVPLSWFVRAVLVPLARALHRYVLRPLGRALVWALALLLTPLAYILTWAGRGLAALWHFGWPVIRALGRAIAYAWQLAGVVLFHLLVRPARWAWRHTVRPVLTAIVWAWRVAVVGPARWFRANVGEPVRTATRSVVRALGLAARPR